ncbi:MAG: TrmH family RNA methyltransferase, partial [Actinomycetota bacterium]
VVEAARSAGLILVAADAGGDVELGTMGADAVLGGPVAWVFGNEAHGVHADLAAAAHETIAIPQYGGAESLNMAAAAAICLYATARAQRGR